MNLIPSTDFQRLVRAASFMTMILAAPLAGQPAGPRVGPGRNVSAPVLPLPESQARALQYMREEEKLARDVYHLLHEKWQLMVFKNISASEESHFQAIGVLLARYQLEDPAADKPEGVYADPALTTRYAQLMAKAAASIKDSLEVGLLIERTDISDLENAVAATDRFDIKRVYSNLMNASFRHLEAFEANLELLGNLSY
jgi:hypothetical protein